MSTEEEKLYDKKGAEIFERCRAVNLPVIEVIIPYIHDSNFLDAGCGIGNDLLVIYQHTGWKGFGCDASPDMLEIAGRRDCAQELRIANLDEEFPFNKEFSVIYTMDVLHHLKSPF